MLRRADVTLLGAPPGTVPNFIDPPTRATEMVAPSIALTTLALIVVLGRIYTKTFITKSFDLSDWLSIGAIVMAIARTVVNCMAVYIWHLGRHVWDLEPWNFASVKNCQFIMDMIYLVGIMFAKLSILVLYVKVFHIRRRFRFLCYVMMAFVVVNCVVFFFIYAFDCKPVYYTWHFSVDHFDCIEITQINVAIGAINIFTDLIIMIMPLPLVWQLQLAKTQKAGLLVVFSTGALICITTIVREVIVVRTNKESDQPWVVADEVIWLTVELNIGIICVCMPALAPVWRKAIASQLGLSYLRSFFSGMSSRGTSRGQSKLSDSDSTSKSRGHIEVKRDWSAHVSNASRGPSSHSQSEEIGLVNMKREVSAV